MEVASGSYGVDAAGRLDSITRNLAGTSADVTTPFGYNRAGQLASETRSNDAYAFDGLYNVDRSYTVNGLNQYSAAGTASFGYDANGNLTASTAPNASGTPVTTAYVYDVENRLVSVSGGASGALRYDPLERLYEINESGSTTRLLYDGDALVGEYATSGTTLRRYAHVVSAGDDPIAWYEGSGLSNTSRRYLYADRLGSITNVVSNSGASLAINTYDEYGIPGSGNEGRFQYTGQAFLEGIGLYHYKARMYSPSLGRFMQTDPIGYADGMNWYNYAGGDPVNAVDPTGMFEWVCVQTFVQVGDGPGTHGVSCFWKPEPGDSLYVEIYLNAFTDRGRDADGISCRSITQDQLDFLGEQFSASGKVAEALKLNPILLVGLAAHESGWGSSLNYNQRNNPFGATPGGDATPGLRYRSFGHAWTSWSSEWGARLGGLGRDRGSGFMSALLQDNRQSSNAVDTRGAYNPLIAPAGDPFWREKVQGAINGVEARLLGLGAGCPVGG